MRWSKLKSLVEARFSPSLGGRVTINSTRYGNCTCGRAWLTLDGEEIANFCTRAYFNRKLSRREPPAQSSNVPFGYGELTRQDAYAACWEFVHHLTIDQAVTDRDPLVQTLAVLDSRVGKQRLLQIDVNGLHPLARKLLLVRLEAEGVRARAETWRE